MPRVPIPPIQPTLETRVQVAKHVAELLVGRVRVRGLRPSGPAKDLVRSPRAPRVRIREPRCEGKGQRPCLVEVAAIGPASRPAGGRGALLQTEKDVGRHVRIKEAGLPGADARLRPVHAGLEPGDSLPVGHQRREIRHGIRRDVGLGVDRQRGACEEA